VATPEIFIWVWGTSVPQWGAGQSLVGGLGDGGLSTRSWSCLQTLCTDFVRRNYQNLKIPHSSTPVFLPMCFIVGTKWHFGVLSRSPCLATSLFTGSFKRYVRPSYCANWGTLSGNTVTHGWCSNMACVKIALLIFTHCRSVAKSIGCFLWHMFVCVWVCVFVCQHDSCWTSKHRTVKLGGMCIVQKSWPGSNLGVIAPWVRTPENVALGYDVGKISAGCLLSSLLCLWQWIQWDLCLCRITWGVNCAV